MKIDAGKSIEAAYSLIKQTLEIGLYENLRTFADPGFPDECDKNCDHYAIHEKMQ